MNNRISSEERWPDFREPKPGELFIDSQAIEGAYQTGYVTGYADSESRYSVNGLRRTLYYYCLISGLVGFIVGAIVARLP